MTKRKTKPRKKKNAFARVHKVAKNLRAITAELRDSKRLLPTVSLFQNGTMYGNRTGEA